MTEKFYTVEQVAEMLEMHPKTIRRYIREGKLNANKVGKGWRITGNDLSNFVEGTDRVAKSMMKTDSSDSTSKDRIKVSSVIDIDVVDMEEAMRIANTLTAVLNSKPPEYGNSTMNVQFIQPENRVRVMLWGNIKFMENMLGSISALTE